MAAATDSQRRNPRPALSAIGVLALPAARLVWIAVGLIIVTSGASAADPPASGTHPPDPLSSGAPAAKVPSAGAGAAGLPIVDPVSLGWTERTGSGVTNLYSQEMLLRCVRDGDADGLKLDLSAEPVLLDGTAVAAGAIAGTVWTAPWPLSGTRTAWDACQFRSGTAVRGGQAGLSVARLANDDDPGWSDRGHIVVRVQLSLVQDGADRDLGTYEFIAGFRRDGESYRRALTVTEGPFVANVYGETPDRAVIAFRTDPAAPARVLVREAPPPSSRARTAESWDRGRPDDHPKRIAQGATEAGSRIFESPMGTRHEVELRDLQPDTEYLYRVEAFGGASTTPHPDDQNPGGGSIMAVDRWTSTEYRFRAAPRPGQGTTRFAYAGDCRMGPGGGLRAFMGVNALVFPQELNAAARMGVRFWLHGGDLVSGYTSVPDDFRSQLRAFKWIATPFLRSVPIYTAIGNHDALVDFYAGPDKQSTGLDHRPYVTESTETILAEELVQPENGPAPSDPRRPPYRRTVFSFSYGPTRVIVINNCYWMSRDPARFGGSPEGFIFPDQMAWLGAELNRADADPTVRHVFLCLHEPPFPNSAHLGDAMWYDGDLAPRGYTLPPEGGAPRPEATGVVETRNEMVRLAAASRKTVAILASDEHNYSRMLLTPETPAGDPARDDPGVPPIGSVPPAGDGDGKLNLDRLSPLPGLRRPIWLVISGGAGAPHYAEEASPWNTWWKANGDRCREDAGCYRFSPLNHWILFEDDGRKVSLRCYSPAGDVIDEVDDLVDALR
jgi:hypothetical protein